MKQTSIFIDRRAIWFFLLQRSTCVFFVFQKLFTAMTFSAADVIRILSWHRSHCFWCWRCAALKVHCSEQSKILLDKLGGYQLEERGMTFMKVRSPPPLIQAQLGYGHQLFKLSRDANCSQHCIANYRLVRHWLTAPVQTLTLLATSVRVRAHGNTISGLSSTSEMC